MAEIMWLMVVVVAVVLLLALIVHVAAHRGSTASKALRPLPAGYPEAYRTQIAQLQTQFVDSPREAVAGARHMVDDLLVRVGYPTRLQDTERLKDLSQHNRQWATWYESGSDLQENATTEDLRRALRAHFDLCFALLSDAAPVAAPVERTVSVRPGRPNIAG